MVSVVANLAAYASLVSRYLRVANNLYSTMSGTSAGGFYVGNAAGHAARPTLACVALAAVAGLGLV